MKKAVLITIMLMTLISTYSFAFKINNGNSEGNSGISSLIKHFSIPSSFNDEIYQVSIALPPTYHENNDKKYPVMYITDGYLNFYTSLGLSQWLLRNNGAGKIDEFIIVAIDFSYDENMTYKQRNDKWFKSRFSDFTPTPSVYKRLGFNIKGQAEQFYQFIEKEVFKHVETNYRIDVNKRTLAGYSLGGLFTSYVLVKHPASFENYLIGDPSLHYGSTTTQETNMQQCAGGVLDSEECFLPDGPIFTYLKDLKTSKNLLHGKIYISSNVGSGNVMMFNTKLFEEQLKEYDRLNETVRLNIKADYFEQENHITGVSRTLQNGILFIYQTDQK